MSAAEVIEQIKQLPEQERAEVAEFVRDFTPAEGSAPAVRFIGRAEAREASDKIFEDYDELFQRLAQ